MALVVAAGGFVVSGRRPRVSEEEVSQLRELRPYVLVERRREPAGQVREERVEDACRFPWRGTGSREPSRDHCRRYATRHLAIIFALVVVPILVREWQHKDEVDAGAKDD